MSILIKGMEMSTTCRDCCLSTFTDFDSMPFCNVTMDDICFNDWEIKRCDNCPLVPVPPHGRCIDVDALIKSLSLDEDDAENGASLLMAIFLEVLKATPTIIEAEEGE